MHEEDAIRSYFQSWLNQDGTVLEQIFHKNAYYSECYGPEYHGLPQIQKWFSDWNQQGKVLQWQIRNFLHQGPITVVEWYFQCEFHRKIDGFDGVSIVAFDESGKIIKVQEFQSRAEHYAPYCDHTDI